MFSQNLIIYEGEYPKKLETAIVDFYGIALCNKGSSVQKVASQAYDLRENNILFFKPGDYYETIIHSDNYSGTFIGFNNSFLLNFYRQHSSILSLSGKEIIQFFNKNKIAKQLFRLIMQKKHEGNNAINEKMIKHMVLSLIYELTNQQQNSLKHSVPVSRTDELFFEFMHFLDENIYHERALHFYATKLFITPDYLSKIIKQKTKISGQEYIYRKVIKLSKGLILQDKNLTISEVSDILNFTDSNSFIRFFRQREGISPGKYRIEKQKK